MPDPTPENFDRLAQLVAELGGHIQLGESLLGSERSIAALLRDGERALIVTQLGDLDVVEHLRAMKRAAGRARDLVDLDDLDAAQPPRD